MNQMMKNIYSGLVHNSVHYIRITNYYEVFENNVTIERYKEIVSFMREIGIEEQ